MIIAFYNVLQGCGKIQLVDNVSPVMKVVRRVTIQIIAYFVLKIILWRMVNVHKIVNILELKIKSLEFVITALKHFTRMVNIIANVNITIFNKINYLYKYLINKLK